MKKIIFGLMTLTMLALMSCANSVNGSDDWTVEPIINPTTDTPTTNTENENQGGASSPNNLLVISSNYSSIDIASKNYIIKYDGATYTIGTLNPTSCEINYNISSNFTISLQLSTQYNNTTNTYYLLVTKIGNNVNNYNITSVYFNSQTQTNTICIEIE